MQTGTFALFLHVIARKVFLAVQQNVKQSVVSYACFEDYAVCPSDLTTAYFKHKVKV